MYSSYRKQKFKSPFMNDMYERWLRGRKTFRAWWKKFMDKGHERLTLMLIPHSEKKIFNLQISNFTIAFFVIILLSVVMFSILSLNEHESSQTEISRLSNLSRTQEGHIAAFKNTSVFTVKNFSKFESQIQRLSENVGSTGGNDVFPFYGQGGPDYTITAEMTKKYGKNFAWPDEIKELEGLNKNVGKSTEQLKRVNAFMDNWKTVLQYTPSTWPVKGGGFKTSGFGRRPSPFTGIMHEHTGVDIAWWPGSPVQVTAAGEVVQVGMMGGYGLCIVVQHKYGFSTRYAHLNNINVNVGETVQRGHIIGGVGNSGNVTGYHLHYEVILGNTAIDPEPYLVSKF